MRFMIMVKATRNTEADDFGAEFTPELRAQEARQREEAERLANAAKR